MIRDAVITVELLPCPCCGSSNIEAGVMSAQSYGVQCRSCRLTVERSSPAKWPKGVWKRALSTDENWKRLMTHVLQLAVTAWNLRATPDPKPVKARIRY